MLERIENHVKDKARAEAEKISAEAKQQADALLASARDEADRKLEADLARLKAELGRELDREVSAVRAARAQEILVDKSRVLDDVFKRAADRLVASAAYWDVVRKRLAELAGREGEILCRAEHRDAMAKTLDALAKETGKPMPALAKDSAAFVGGFLLRGDKMDVDVTLESELAALRERILPELAAKAFPES